MREKQTIIKLFMEGVSERAIAKRTKKSRNTVRKYIQSYEESKQEDVRNLPISEDVVKAPTYKKRTGKKRVLTEGIKKLLRGYIKDNEWKKHIIDDRGEEHELMLIIVTFCSFISFRKIKKLECYRNKLKGTFTSY